MAPGFSPEADLPLHRPREELLHHRVLTAHVGNIIVNELGCELRFMDAVRLRSGGMGTQVISQSQELGDLNVTFLAHMDVGHMLSIHQLGKVVPSGRPRDHRIKTLASALIAKAMHVSMVNGDRSPALHLDQNVDRRLGGQSGHGGTANMVDAHEPFLEDAS